MKVMTIRLLTIIFIVVFLTSCNKNIEVITPDNIIDNGTVTLVVGASERLIATDGAGNELSNADWTSSDTSVAVVSNSGYVTGVSEGKTSVIMSNGKNNGTFEIIVSKSPIENFTLPNVDARFINTAPLVITGEGWQDGDELWLTPVVKTKGIPNSLQAFLIMEAEKWRMFQCKETPPVGNYSITLKRGTDEYNLGSVEYVASVDTPFEYNPDVVFYDDTDWRLLKLRGKVKSVRYYWPSESDYLPDFISTGLYYETITSRWHGRSYYEAEFSSSGKYICEKDGRCHSNDSIYVTTTKYSYDDQNRCEKITESGDGAYLFEYGTHNKYVWSSALLSLKAATRDFNQFWIKGLSNDCTSRGGTTEYFAAGDSIVTYQSGEKWYTTYYDGSFPTDRYNSAGGVQHWTYSSKGMLISHYQGSKEENTSVEEYVENSPFMMLKRLETATDEEINYYDSNGNIIRSWMIGKNDDYCENDEIEYIAYDQYGNWTQRIITIDIDREGEDNDSYGHHIQNRTITYWD